MQFSKLSTMIGTMLCILTLSGCILRDSPAPGCIESIGLPSAGGCFGKTAIVDLEVVSAPDCVMMDVNNCNGGVLEIRNTCEEIIRLDGIEISPSGSINLDIIENQGSIEVIETDRNISQYIPEVDRRIMIIGVVGNQTIKLAFTKTKPLCE